MKINVNGLTDIDMARLTAHKILADLPLNKSWMTFGFLLGLIVSPIIISII